MWEVIGGRRPRGQRVRQIRAVRGLTVVLTLLAAVSAVDAGVFSFQWDRPDGFDGTAGPFQTDDDAGLLNNLTLSYDSNAQRLTFLAAFDAAPSQSNKPFGLTLVLNNGPDITGSTNEYAILRFLTGNESRNPVISAFAYNGSTQRGNQWFHRRADRIATSRNDASWVNAVSAVDSAAGRVIAFDIDVSAINGFAPPGGDPADWFGVGFDETIGLWLNSYTLNLPGVTGNAPLSGRSTQRGWLWGPRGNVDAGLFRFNDQPTTVNIPEPASLALMALGMGTICRRAKHNL